MIAKKNSRYDLERKRIVFFQVGLFVTGAFTLAAFTYKTPIEADNRKEKVAFDRIEIFEEDVKEVPKKVDVVREVPKPPSVPSTPTVAAQAQPSETITTVSTTTDPKAGVHVNTGTLAIDDFVDPGLVNVIPEPIDIPDVDAAFIGGYSNMMQFIKDNLNYPQDAIELNIQGRVYVSFVVEKDGSISNVNVERGVYKSIDREATRIVGSFPVWKPGEVKANKVRTRVRLPLNFVLN